MTFVRQRRDNRLLDAIEAVTPDVFSGVVWHVVREGRDPVSCSRSGGRWDDGTFDVLYTSLERDGALSEMRFHLSRGQPVIPSQIRFRLFELQVTLGRVLRLEDMAALQKLGLETARYGQMSWQEKEAEYPRSQDIGEAAHFLDYDGLLVPSARQACLNAIIFCDRVLPDAIAIKADHGFVEWR